MAKCTKLNPPQPLPEYLLALSTEEAQFFLDVLGRGIIGVGRRAHADRVYAALVDAGLRCRIYDFTGSLNFHDLPYKQAVHDPS